MENFKDEPGEQARNAVPPFVKTTSGIDGVHPALVEHYKNIRVINYLHLAVLALLIVTSIGRPGQILFIIPLAFVYGLVIFSKIKKRRKLKELSSQLERDGFVSTTIELKYSHALGIFKKYSGTLIKETNFTSPHQPINFNPPVGGQKQQPFDTPSAIPANLYVDPDSKKVLAVNTSKGIFLVDNDLGSGMSPWGRAALNIGIAAVMLPTGIVIGFLCAAGSLDRRLPHDVPKGLTAVKYYELGRRYKEAGWTELSRKALTKAIEMDQGDVGKKAGMFLKAKIPHKPVSEEAVMMNIKGFNEAIFSPRGSEKTWKECIEKYPEFEWPYSNLGSQYLTEKRYDEAAVLLNKALELNPYYTNALVRMAQLKLAKGDKAGAEKCVNSALEYEPDNQEAQDLKGRL